MSNKWKGAPIKLDPINFNTQDGEPSDESEKYRDYEGNPLSNSNDTERNHDDYVR